MDDKLKIQIGERIAEVRYSRGLTQEDLAEQLGVTPKHISHVECGTSCLSLKYLINLSEILDCSLDYILLGKRKDSVLSKLPQEIADILNAGNENDIDPLIRYLQLYVELIEKQD